MRFIFTVCASAAGEACPVWLGHPTTAHWGVPDPAAVTGDAALIRQAFEAAFVILKHRVELFVALPLDALDITTLQRELARIGTAQS